MLRELVEKGSKQYGQSKATPLGYGKRKLDYIVDLYPDSQIEIIDAKKSDIDIPPAPTSASRTSGLVPLPFVDQAAYILGVSTKKNGTDSKAEEKYKQYTELLNEMAASYIFQSELIQEAISVLKRVRDSGGLLTQFKDRGIELQSDIWLGFRFQKDNLKDRFLFDLDETKRFWAEKTKEKSQTSSTYECMVCGNNSEIINMLPGNETPKIISINASSFVSYRTDFKGAPLGICLDCANVAVKTFNELRQSNMRWIVQDKSAGGKINRESFSNIWALYWLKNDTNIVLEGTEFNPLEILLYPLSGSQNVQVQTTKALVEKFLGVPWSGSEASLNVEENEFYLLLVSPNKTRLIVRDFIHLSPAKAKSNLSRYIKALTLDEDNRPVTIEEIVNALQNKDIFVTQKLIRTAYLGESMPPSILVAAISRIRKSALWRFYSIDRPAGVRPDKYESGRKEWLSLCSLLKAYLTLKEGVSVVEAQRQKIGYHLGELLAVLEEAQKRSSGNTSSTITNRYFGSAMTTPTAVFPSLVASAVKAHLPKIKRDSKGYTELEMELERIMENIDLLGGMPSVLFLEQQAEFILGFYSKRAEFERKRRVFMESKNEVNAN